MKLLNALIISLFLTGCVTFPVEKKFPGLPESLSTNCPELKLVPENTDKLSVVLSVVTENYSQYHECRIKIETWMEWYKVQKEIYEKK